jgi:hypothetical protein
MSKPQLILIYSKKWVQLSEKQIKEQLSGHGTIRFNTNGLFLLKDQLVVKTSVISTRSTLEISFDL